MFSAATPAAPLFNPSSNEGRGVPERIPYPPAKKASLPAVPTRPASGAAAKARAKAVAKAKAGAAANRRTHLSWTRWRKRTVKKTMRTRARARAKRTKKSEI